MKSRITYAEMVKMVLQYKKIQYAGKFIQLKIGEQQCNNQILLINKSPNTANYSYCLFICLNNSAAQKSRLKYVKILLSKFFGDTIKARNNTPHFFIVFLVFLADKLENCTNTQ